MSGLFVQKHADAVRAQGCEVRVIFSQTWRDTWCQWSALRREGWMPDLVQLNVIQKQGLLALWLKHRYGIPYVIVEHFTGYLPSSKNISPHSLHTAFMRYICKNAEVVMPVSKDLKKAMQALDFKAKRWEIIDNVVDDFFFDIPKQRNNRDHSGLRNSGIPDNRKTLLNITCFDEPHKNVKGLLRAAKMLSEKRQDWQLVLVGTGIDYKDVRAYADTLDIPENLLRWTGELTPRKVAEEMAHADAFVLSSRYETYGVVLAEAAAAGLPILSTPVGIAEEIADLIVPQEIAQYKPGKFAEFIETILWSPVTADRQQLASIANANTYSRFSAEAVGKQLKEIYTQCMVSE